MMVGMHIDYLFKIYIYDGRDTFMMLLSNFIYHRIGFSYTLFMHIDSKIPKFFLLRPFMWGLF